MGLRPEVTAAVESMGFETPTEIQRQAIPYLLQQPHDLIALAQTGTGKTAAFGLPIVNEVAACDGVIKALIISPTRELALQITEDVKKFSKFLPLKVQAVYGGADIDKQVRGLRKSHIVVGTPGRMVDLIKRDKLHIDQLRYLVLDEADEMLTMGFKEDLDFILSHTPEQKRTLLFSATMPKAILSIAKTYMHAPHKIEIGARNQGAQTVVHHYYLTTSKQRYEALKRVVDSNPSVYGIVFCRTRRETKETADKLMRDGYQADALHGDMSQAQRDLVMRRFRLGHLRLLVATDVAARGVDVRELTHVINYNLPDDDEVYVHRSGRTGRAGKTGISISLVTAGEARRLRGIQRTIGKDFIRQSLPNAEAVLQAQAIAWADRLNGVILSEQHRTQLEAIMPHVEEKLQQLSKTDLLKRMLSMTFDSFLNYYEGAEDLQPEPDLNHPPAKRWKKGDKGAYTRFFIDKGKKDRLTKAKLMGLINRAAQTRGIAIGTIEILECFSFFQADAAFESELLQALKRARYDGKGVRVEPDRNRSGAGKFAKAKRR